MFWISDKDKSDKPFKCNFAWFFWPTQAGRAPYTEQLAEPFGFGVEGLGFRSLGPQTWA